MDIIGCGSIGRTQEFYKTLEDLRGNLKPLKNEKSEVQQVLSKALKWTTPSDSHLSCLAVSGFVHCGLLSVDMGLSLLQQQFLFMGNDQMQRVIFWEFLNLLWEDLKASNYEIRQTPWSKHPLNFLEGNESLTEDLVIAFAENPDRRIVDISAAYLKPLLFNLFKTGKDLNLLFSIWKYLLAFKRRDSPGDLNQSKNLSLNDLPLQLINIFNFKENPKLGLDLLHIALTEQDHRGLGEFTGRCLLLMAANLKYLHGDISKYLNKLSQCDILEDPAIPTQQILYALVRLISEVPVGNLDALMALIVKLSEREKFPVIIWNIALDSVIQWVSKPTPFITANTHKAFERIFTLAKAEERPDIALPERGALTHYFPDITLSFIYVRSYVILERKPELTKSLIAGWNQTAVEDFSEEDLIAIRAMILSPRFSDYLKDLLNVLRRLVKRNNISSFITPYLFKMAQEADPKCQLQLLKFLPEFAENKENIPIILSTLRKLDKNPVLDLICLELYYNLWRIDHRLYSYLFEHLTYLQGRWKNSIETQLVVIATIYRICQTEASQHFPDLVKLISDIINGEHSNHFNGVIMTIALDTIRILCEKRTINVISTWNAIKGKFRDENRKSVKARLYKLFGIMPGLSIATAEFESFEDEIVSSLWTDLMAEEDQELIDGILNALKNFPFETFKFVRWPEIFRVNVQLPKSHLAHETEEEYVQNFPYIPGECWIQMLEKVPECVLKSIPILLCPLIEKEAKSFRGVFNLPEGKQEPKSLVSVHPKSVLKAILEFLVVETRNGFPNTELVCAAIMKCLAKGFGRPMPFDWRFLEKQYAKSLEVREDCLNIFCNHVEVSPSAQGFLKKYLLELDLTTASFEEVLIITRNFHKICPKLSINEAEIFLRNTLEYYNGDPRFKRIFQGLQLDELEKDLKVIVNEVLSRIDANQLADEITDPEMKEFIKEVDEYFEKELSTILDTTADAPHWKLTEVRDFMRNCKEQKPAEKIYWLQEVASRYKLCQDERNLDCYGFLLIYLIKKFSKLSSVGFLKEYPIDDWDLFAQVLNEQSSFNTADGSLSQVFRCIWTRKSSTPMATRLKLGLLWVEDYKLEILRDYESDDYFLNSYH